MPLEIEVTCPVFNSFRVQQIAGMFDVPLAARASERFKVDVPNDVFANDECAMMNDELPENSGYHPNPSLPASEKGPSENAGRNATVPLSAASIKSPNQQINKSPNPSPSSTHHSSFITHHSPPWSIGLIVGPSGSGKSTIARAMFPDRIYRPHQWPTDQAVIDGLGPRPIKEIIRLFTAVGFSSPPSWIKPYQVLSNGEQFRCDLARALAGQTNDECGMMNDELPDSSGDDSDLFSPVAEEAPVVRATISPRPLGEGPGVRAVPLDAAPIKSPNLQTNKSPNPSSSSIHHSSFILHHSPLAVFDEFTSVVDRNVARVVSAAVSRGIRSGQIACRFVAVTCHYDIADWLAPDWIIDMATGTFTRRCLRRPTGNLPSPFGRGAGGEGNNLPSPLENGAGAEGLDISAPIQSPNLPIPKSTNPTRPPIHLELFRCNRSAWPLFARHHYLSGALSHYARCFLATWEGVPVAFCATLALIGQKNRWRISRIVTLPDYQGIGIGMAVAEAVADLHVREGNRVNVTASHPSLIAHCRRSPHWRAVNVKKTGSRSAQKFRSNYHGSPGRAVVSFEYFP